MCFTAHRGVGLTASSDIMDRVKDADLIDLAAAYGVETSYTDWRGEVVDVGIDTIRAVLRALGSQAVPAERARPGRVRARAAVPEEANTDREWGLTVQLYSLRSRRSWGLGDLRDLADLATWSARAQGAGFVLVNPVHAAEPAPPVRPSPYLPTSRRFTGPLYLHVEDVAEYGSADPAVRRLVDAWAGPLRARNATLDPIDRDTVWTTKRAALEELYAVPATPARRSAYEAFREHEGDDLTAFATWCALAEIHGDDWRDWPAPLRDPSSPAVIEHRNRLRHRVDFHSWLQWLLDEQLDTAQRAARAAGMSIGVIHDLAVGVHPGGADAWMYQRLFAPGMSVGAPPDEFNQRGQDWEQPPWHPGLLAEAGYAPYRDMLRHALRHAGGLRLDHAMQVFRLWWIPEGASPDEGTYVGYDHRAMLDVLMTEARRVGALVVGEDLGTVEGWMRDALAERGVLGTSMAWFERGDDGRPLWPQRWRRQCLATVGTHDMPPVSGYLHGDHVALRERLDLLTHPAAEERAGLERSLAQWRAVLTELGLLDPADVGDVGMTRALHAFLMRTPARLVGISLADAVGERRTQNQPGTTDEYPNWRIPLADAAGRPVLLDDLPGDGRFRTVVAPLHDSAESSTQRVQ